ncbi:glycosyltransferase BC10-like [Lolium rigidum]|uniref:glycosyltransferase BC10-like n=1 Tax=Lolium rigidum TaxID=89674 RepID=UPI001F5C7240|nr:glycosyltransferase BC10-like [Lolium rigidum]
MKLKSRRGSVGDEESPGADAVGSLIAPLTPRKDCWWSSALLKAITVLLVLVTGVLIGFAASANISRCYFYTPLSSSSSSSSDHHRHLQVGGDGDDSNSNSKTQQTQQAETQGSSPSPPSFMDFVHPGSPWGHTMSDEELFWRASMVPRVEEYPYQRVPKVAFLFLTRGPLPFARLWERFFRGHNGLYSVYVHALPNYVLNVSASSPFYGRQIPSQEVSWGSITLVDAEKRLLANALLDHSNQRFVLVSESCVPVYNFPTVYEYLVNSAHSFVESYNIDVPQCAGRYNPRMAPDVMEDQWRKGSEWFELSRDLALDIVADKRYHAVFRQHCTPSCYPDEHYIPTYLHLTHGARNANRTITWVDWSRGGPHPARYGKGSVTTEFIQAIRNNGTQCDYNGKPTNVCYLFARKFAPSALGTLINLTTTLLDF